MSRRLVTAKQRADDARAGPENRPAASGGSVAPIWVLNIGMAIAAAVLYVVAVAPLRRPGGVAILSIALLVVGFAVAEWWRVFIHFRQEAQSYSLSEIPLVIGVFVLAGDPGELVLARVLGAAIGLGLLRRQEPIRLVFNLASFAIETETLLLLVNHISGTQCDQLGGVAVGAALHVDRIAPRIRTQRDRHLPGGGPAVTSPMAPADRDSAHRRFCELQPRTGDRRAQREQPADAAPPADTAFRHRRRVRALHARASEAPATPVPLRVERHAPARELRRRGHPRAPRPALQGLPRRHRGCVVAAGGDGHRLVAHDQHDARRQRQHRYRNERRAPRAFRAAAGRDQARGDRHTVNVRPRAADLVARAGLQGRDGDTPAGRGHAPGDAGRRQPAAAAPARSTQTTSTCSMRSRRRRASPCRTPASATVCGSRRSTTP